MTKTTGWCKYESDDSAGTVSLKSLFDGYLEPSMIESPTLDDLIYLTVRGGWPESIGIAPNIAGNLPKQYLEAIVQDDVFQLDGIGRDYQKFKMLIRALARNESTIVSNNKLKRDIVEYEHESINVDTVGEYLNVLDRLFLIDNQPAFKPSIRSKIRVGKSPKRHFSDPSLAIAALDVSIDQLKGDLNTFGFMFEAMCVRDLRIYAETFGAKLYHYRDYNNYEIDAVIELQDGRWGAFEIKLGANQIDLAAKNLLKISDVFKASNPAFKPSILVVICGMIKLAYQREDGVYVVPITVLRP